ncbi:dTDP-4-dehydrorhamnose 3,5-epimerase [Rothia nasimurium]|uniref:dTDP-4-dehydrorhamnose 3,5-epimerase n=1 Tax=Luteibacter anthropi TaxID=564369 RepID=A0A7X5ZKD3_9GAMM|nr:dTDP-4-dehydrorhamnose 3,5-epimerase [Luteibacter anthropi]NII08973.1 dTDP-4-dehydrorhamnose 3,5-epimerase [Luteibacter anthropi]
MTIFPTALAGLHVIRTDPMRDERGRFVRTFCEDELTPIRPGIHWQQANLSATHGRGAIRGMHFQHPPASELKLVRCLRGRVFDVAVDLRAGSPTFLQWHGEELSEDNERMLLIPEGFAHGFQLLEDHAELLYMHSAAYSPEHDGRIRFDEPRVGIAWPLATGIVSARDLATPPLTNDFPGVIA